MDSIQSRLTRVGGPLGRWGLCTPSSLTGLRRTVKLCVLSHLRHLLPDTLSSP